MKWREEQNYIMIFVIVNTGRAPLLPNPNSMSHLGDQRQRSRNARKNQAKAGERWRTLIIAGPSLSYRHMRLAIVVDRRWTLMNAGGFEQVQNFQRTPACKRRR